MKKITLLLIGALFLFGCSKEDDKSTDKGVFSFNKIKTEEGIYLELTHLGKVTKITQEVTGSTVNGWNGGQLLDGAYYRLLRLYNDYGRVEIRVSMPKSISWASFDLEQTHPLNLTKLALESSSSISDAYFEVYFGSSTGAETFPNNATGTIKFRDDLVESSTGNKYAFAGEIDAKLSDKDGNPATLKGIFWRK